MPKRARPRTFTQTVTKTVRPRYTMSKAAGYVSFGGRRRSRNARTAGYLGIETKFYDVGRTPASISGLTNGTTVGLEIDPTTENCLNAVSQGDGEQQRDGRKISMVDVIVRGTLQVVPQTAQTAVDVAPVVNVYLVLDKQTNGATLNSEDVFASLTTTTNTVSSLNRNLEYDTRFRVLATKQIRVPAPRVTGTSTAVLEGGVHVPFTLYKNLAGMKTTFTTGTTSLISNITDTSLHIIAFQTTSSSGTTEAVSLAYQSRLRFRG